MKKIILVSLSLLSPVLLAVGIFLSLATPAYAANQQIALSVDTYAEEGFPAVAPWNNKNFYIGYDTYYNKKQTRAYLNFTIRDLEIREILPMDILSADLNIYQYIYQGISSYYLDVYETTSPWSETSLTWLNQPAAGAHVSHSQVTQNPGWKNLDITPVVLNKLNGLNTSGLTVRTTNPNNPAGIFWSSACQFAPTPPRCSSGQQPNVVVLYKPNTPPDKPQLLTPDDGHTTNNSLIVFEATPTTDPNGEVVKYKFEVSSNKTFTAIVAETGWQDLPLWTHDLNKQGVFYWRVKAIDEHGPKTGISISNVRTLTIDKEPPTIPVIMPEPPYTQGNSNTIEWNPSSDTLSPSILYFAEMAADNDFKHIVKESGWIATESITFENLADGKKYYYRVKAKDLATNESGFSDTTCSTQDFNPPKIDNFTLSNSLISPFNKTSHGKLDSTRIQAEVTDTTLKNWTLAITNSKHQIVSIFPNTSGNKLDINWPADNPKIRTLKNGFYFAYITATDEFGNTKHSNSLRIEVDDISPTTPNITKPRKNQLINKKTIQIQASVERYTTNHIKLNGKTAKTITSTSTINTTITTKKEGSNTIEIVSIDKAQNQSSSKVSLTVDTIPPATPRIRLEANSKNKSIAIVISGEKNSTALVYVNGNLSKTVTMKSHDQKVTIVKKWRPGHKYSVFAKLKDPAQNTSKTSNTETYITPTEKKIGTGGWKDKPISFPAIPGIKTCNIKVHKDKKTYEIKSCNIPSPSLAHVENRGEVGKNTFWMDLYGSVQTKLKIKVTHMRCKPRTFWDPRTWFTCVDQQFKKTEKKINLRNNLQPKITKSSSAKVYRSHLDSSSHFMIELYTYTNPQNQKISAKNTQRGSTKESGVWIDIRKTSRYSSGIKIPKANTPEETGRYFAFFFNRNIGVTQWHGYTAYQSPHMGIDFGSVNEPLFSPANGYVRAVGWDSYYGKCLSGGYYIRIEHDNGMHSAYLHLANYKKTGSTNWKPGDRILKGQRIGTTGNTGAWNCQPLGYHLHFELRKTRYQSSHVDPVPYIEIDWNKIPTLGWKTYPGRLTGDNPHPTF